MACPAAYRQNPTCSSFPNSIADSTRLNVFLIFAIKRSNWFVSFVVVCINIMNLDVDFDVFDLVGGGGVDGRGGGGTIRAYRHIFFVAFVLILLQMFFWLTRM